MKRFPLTALLAGASLIGAGYLFHSGFLFWVGAFFALGLPLGRALWGAQVAKSRIITAMDDKLHENDRSRRSSDR